MNHIASLQVLLFKQGRIVALSDGAVMTFVGSVALTMSEIRVRL